MTSAIVFLDLTEMDQTLIAYARDLKELMNFQRLCFVHYVELQDVSDDFSSYFPDARKPLPEIITDEIGDELRAVRLEPEEVTIEIFSDGGQEGLMDWINESDHELCIFGKKKRGLGSGVFAGKVARLVNKSILFATRQEGKSWHHLLLSTDFSPYARKAAGVASELAVKLGAMLTVTHVYKTPAMYFPFFEAKSEELLSDLRNEAQKELNQFCQKHCEGGEVETELLHAQGEPVARQIYDYARENKVSLIIMGHKGRNDDDGLLIGSVAERLIQSDKEIPVLLVKA